MSERPFDIILPPGWTWALVEQHRARWHIADNMVPVAQGPACVAWGTINSVRKLRDRTVAGEMLAGPDWWTDQRVVAEIDAYWADLWERAA